MSGIATMTPPDQLLTVRQVRQRYGMGRSFLYYQIERGRIAAVKRRGRLFVRMSSVAAFQAMSPRFVSPDGKRFYDKTGAKPYGDVRATTSISVRFTPSERAAIERVATETGMSVSDVCRIAVGDAVAEYDEGAASTLRTIRRKRPAA